MKRIVLGISGASGALIPMRIVERLSNLPDIEIHLIISDAARKTLNHEIGPSAEARLEQLVTQLHPIDAIGASIASGSFFTAGMIVAPCSMRSLAAITHGLSDNLLTRAADVHLKERRKLILLARETPLHLGHLRNMVSVTEMGAIIMPPVPAFYNRPTTIEEAVDDIACRTIDLLAINSEPMTKQWDGNLLAKK